MCHRTLQGGPKQHTLRTKGFQDYFRAIKKYSELFGAIKALLCGCVFEGPLFGASECGIP